MQRPADRLPSPLTLLRVGLAVFLELHFFVGALRPAPARRPDRGPQPADRERYGYGNDTEELLLVRAGGEEVWIPYSGETADEVRALIAEGRDRPVEEGGVGTVAAPERARLRPAVGRFLAGLGVIGALALILGSSRAAPAGTRSMRRRAPRRRRASPTRPHESRRSRLRSDATNPGITLAPSSTQTALPPWEATSPT